MWAVKDTQLGTLRPLRRQSSDLCIPLCISHFPQGSKPSMKGETMLFVFIMAVVMLVFAYAIIDKQYKIEREYMESGNE
jgi:hypothetical protein